MFLARRDELAEKGSGRGKVREKRVEGGGEKDRGRERSGVHLAAEKQARMTIERDAL